MLIFSVYHFRNVSFLKKTDFKFELDIEYNAVIEHFKKLKNIKLFHLHQTLFFKTSSKKTSIITSYTSGL